MTLFVVTLFLEYCLPAPWPWEQKQQEVEEKYALNNTLDSFPSNKTYRSSTLAIRTSNGVQVLLHVQQYFHALFGGETICCFCSTRISTCCSTSWVFVTHFPARRGLDLRPSKFDSGCFKLTVFGMYLHWILGGEREHSVQHKSAMSTRHFRRLGLGQNLTIITTR